MPTRILARLLRRPITEDEKKRWAKWLWAFPLMALAYGSYHSWSAEVRHRDRIASMNAREQADQGLFENAEHGYIILDPEGKVLVWNKAMVTKTGYTEDEMLGETLERLMFPEEWDEHHVKYARMIGTRNAEDSPARRIPCRVKTKWGAVLNVIVRVTVVYSKIDDYNYAIGLVDEADDVVTLGDHSSEHKHKEN